MATSSLSIAAAAATTTSSNPLLFNSRNLPFECSSVSIPPSRHKLFTLTIKPNFSFSSPFICSSSSINLEFPQTTEPQEETEDEEFDEYEGDYDDDGDDRVESHSAEAGRLYVGNLPYAMTSSQLADIFAEAGPVLSVEIVYDRVTDRSRGFAFVTMAGVEEAKVAIRMFNGSQVGGRTVKVNFPEVPRGGEREVMGPKIRSSYQSFVDSPHKLYAGNLSWSVTSQQLKEFFADQPESVESALNELNGVDVEGRILRLNMAEDRARQTPPPTVERNF
ncbi:33 kDa ribonucleoprotein, chloroplastic [Heracleum sosnowskyi]|uniref:33 kDa ribonucleoprotein, chloroplastic n=1 Tax=Heracleum sosnowskyi TaxID=360622 RepID=A0AAD8JI07_9APIA|nr:33 kDa ribonucleoprotein, chloroplastic [Heracleum sosnowskyi]